MDTENTFNAACEARLASDTAWRKYFYHGDRSLSEGQLERRHGEPSWSALTYRTLQAEIDGELTIERSHEISRRGPFYHEAHVSYWLAKHSLDAETLRAEALTHSPQPSRSASKN